MIDLDSDAAEYRGESYFVEWVDGEDLAALAYLIREDYQEEVEILARDARGFLACSDCRHRGRISEGTFDEYVESVLCERCRGAYTCTDREGFVDYLPDQRQPFLW